jgi:hypothetical protein
MKVVVSVALPNAGEPHREKSHRICVKIEGVSTFL